MLGGGISNVTDRVALTQYPVQGYGIVASDDAIFYAGTNLLNPAQNNPVMIFKVALGLPGFGLSETVVPSEGASAWFLGWDGVQDSTIAVVPCSEPYTCPS